MNSGHCLPRKGKFSPEAWGARRMFLIQPEKLNRGVSKPGCFPLFSGKVQVVSRTLLGLFLVGALNRPRKWKRANRENPRTIPEQIGKILEKSGKSQKGQKRTKKEGQVQIGKPPPFETPPFGGPRVSDSAPRRCSQSPQHPTIKPQ